MLINILWHPLGANKYGRLLQVGELDLFLAVAEDCGIVVYINQSQQNISPCFG